MTSSQAQKVGPRAIATTRINNVYEMIHPASVSDIIANSEMAPALQIGRMGVSSENEKEWNDFESVLNALDKFIKSGKIRYIGMSNETPYGLSKYLEISKNKNLPRMMSVQNPYSLVNRTYEIGMSEISIREKCGLLVYYPLASGALSGKYRDGQMPKNARITLFKGWERMINPLAMKAYDEYYKLAKENNITMVQLAQAFVNSRPFVTSNIIGATSIDQLKENKNNYPNEIKEIEKEKEAVLEEIKTERYSVAETVMTREVHRKLLEIIKGLETDKLVTFYYFAVGSVQTPPEEVAFQTLHNSFTLVNTNGVELLSGGTNLTTIKFSFKPLSLSTLPLIVEF